MVREEKFNLCSLYSYRSECFRPPISSIDEVYIGRVLGILFPEGNWNNTW